MARTPLKAKTKEDIDAILVQCMEEIDYMHTGKDKMIAVVGRDSNLDHAHSTLAVLLQGLRGARYTFDLNMGIRE